MENINPLDRIPDKWHEKSRCPLCSTSPMHIEHNEDEPDWFICPKCELCFHVAQGAPSVYVLQDPEYSPTGYLGQWVEMKTLIQLGRTLASGPKSISVPEEKPPQKATVQVEDEEEPPLDPIYDKYPSSIIESALSLYEMGNSRQSIRDTLLRNSQLSEDGVEEIVNFVTRQKRKKEGGSFKLPRWAIGCITIPIVLLISYLVVMLFFRYSFQNELATSTSSIEYTVVDFEKLPGFLQNIIPEDIQNSQMPKAVVTKLPTTTLPQAACPTTEQGAVSLFGGQIGDWEYNAQQDSWVLQATYLRTLNLPQDYIAVMPSLNNGLVLQFASGPARIQNAYFVMINCP